MSANFTCPRCGGRVQNIPTKRRSEEQLREIHREACRR